MSDNKGSGTALARVPTGGAMAHPPALEFTHDQRQMIRDTYARGASDQEFAVLLEISKVRNLNPLLKQIYFVKRYDKKLGRDVWTPQVAIDGLLAIAQRTGLFNGQDPAEFEYADNGKGRLRLCRVKVYRKDWDRPSVGIAFWDESVQTYPDGNPTDFWKRMPHRMLEKVALSIALRKAFSEVTGGLGVEGVHEEVSAEVEEPGPPQRTVVIEGTIEAPAPAARAEAPRREDPDDAEPPASEPPADNFPSSYGTKAPEPGAPRDHDLPFTEGKWAGKKLSDIETEKDFVWFINGYRAAAAKATDEALCKDKQLWAARVQSWASHRGFKIE